MKYSFIEYLFVYLRCEVINMVVVVLKASTSFAGIDYNERKNEEGKSELLVAENFAMNPDNLKKSDYIAYMESVCRTNPAVKAKQFHAVISCKGREYSAEDLKNVALQYINKMGYGNNPYMIYFHSDTENNHVHIVSTRVQKNGQKVKDNMEAVRSQKVINQIMNVDLALKAKDDISKYMEFSFSTVQQYKLLLEQSGWKLREKDGLLILYKGGEKHASIQLEQIKDKAKQYTPDEERRKQITALLFKYKQGLSYTELQTLMKDKFGINLVFHTGKGHTKPYGYTLIDYRNKRVLKGGEVMDLKELLVEPNKQAKVEHCNSIINLLLKDGTKYTMDSFKKLMLDYGYRFSMNGTIFINGDDKALLVLDKKLLKELRYNSRVYEANKFNVATLKEAELLSRIYHVKKDDILIQEHMDKKNTVYTDMINSYLAHSSDLHSTLREKGILFVEDDNLVYLIDKKNKVIVSTDDLGINIIKDGYSKDRITLVTLDKMERINVEQDSELARGFNLIDAICDILSQHINVQQDKSPNRKKKRGQQQN